MGLWAMITRMNHQLRLEQGECAHGPRWLLLPAAGLKSRVLKVCVTPAKPSLHYGSLCRIPHLRRRKLRPSDRETAQTPRAGLCNWNGLALGLALGRTGTATAGMQWVKPVTGRVA